MSQGHRALEQWRQQQPSTSATLRHITDASKRDQNLATLGNEATMWNVIEEKDIKKNTSITEENHESR